MKIREKLLENSTIDNTLDISWYLADNPNKLPELFAIFWGENKTLTQRASAVIIELTYWKPKLIKPFVEEMIMMLKQKGVNDTIKRNTVRILAEFPIPNHMEGVITEICFNFLNKASEAVAIQVFSMTILERMADKYPELKVELMASIEQGMEFGSAGYRSRGGKILGRLK